MPRLPQQWSCSGAGGQPPAARPARLGRPRRSTDSHTHTQARPPTPQVSTPLHLSHPSARGGPPHPAALSLLLPLCFCLLHYAPVRGTRERAAGRGARRAASRRQAGGSGAQQCGGHGAVPQPPPLRRTSTAPAVQTRCDRGSRPTEHAAAAPGLRPRHDLVLAHARRSTASRVARGM